MRLAGPSGSWCSPASESFCIGLPETSRIARRLSVLVFRFICSAFTQGGENFIVFLGLPLIFTLQTAFYVTESSAFRNQILYFRHDDWAALCAPLIDRLTTVTFEKLTTVGNSFFSHRST